jgi:hypothetical protein
MPKYRVPLTTYASASILVETDETDPEKILEEALGEGVPGICAQCSGWGRNHSLEVGDEWEPVQDVETGEPEIYEESDAQADH